ncbi:nucleotide disphospho-sugar-binding domain-containing protein [Streptomyces sp. NPDC059352]|uniref:nucleotide disphospho-sugar-binding domain-containing protein n=1 Tax=Streptomyces sp. NPDC059352 TaxID=3346810 RepID=UPI0036BE140C
MRVLFTARHSVSHLLAMTAAAQACASAGHEVRTAGPAGAVLPTAALGTSPPHDWHPDLVVSAEDGATGAGAAVTGVTETGPRGSFPGARVVRWTPLDHRSADGPAPVRIDPCPPALRGDAGADALSVRQPICHAGQLPYELREPHHLLRVCLRPGAPGSPHGWSPERLRLVARAALGLDVEVIALVPAAERARLGGVLGPLGSRLRFAEQELLGPVLATCVAVAHEGGPDVTLEAAAHGVTQLVIADTRPAGDRLDRIGAGHRLVAAEEPRETGSSLRLRRHLADLLYGGRALATAQRLRSAIAALPSPEAFAGRLEDLAAR